MKKNYRIRLPPETTAAHQHTNLVVCLLATLKNLKNQ
jgi:hypothetical protein